MSETLTGRVEIGFDVYNPFDPEFVKNPFPVFDRMLSDYPVAFHTGINSWLVTPHDLASEVLKSPKLSSRLADSGNPPPVKPEAEWNLYDQMMNTSLLTVERPEHLRLRRLTAPAFSRRVMDQIEARIKDSITAIFDEIPDPRAFDAATDIAAKVPVRSIADMVGVPAEAGELFEHSMGWNLVRAGNPLYPLEEREEYIQGSLPGLQYLLDMVNERRASKDPGDDFIGTLVTYSEDGDRLTDAEIVSVISALVTAGADTAVDLHAYAVKALIENPSQREILRSRPELGEAAVLEVLRSSGIGKFGGIPRFPYEDMEFGGQKLGKGEWVMALFAPAMIDPAKWGPSAREFDITRDLAGNIVFGAGPHLCIGLNLVKVQGQLMMEEFIRRFGDTAEVAGEITFDPMHFNARRMTSLPVRTGA